MIYLLFIPLVAMIVLGSLSAHNKWVSFSGEADTTLIGLGIGFLVVLLFIVGLTTLHNGRGLAEWQAFYNATSKNYEIAVDETASYLSIEKYTAEALIPIDGSIERFKLTESVSARIAEWRDAVSEYNKTIASMQYFDSNPFTGVLVPDEVQDMKLLIIE